MDQSKRVDTGRKARRGDKGKKWSESLSPEARVAMQLALEDTKAMKLANDAGDGQPNDPGVKPSRVAFTDKGQAENEDKPQSDLSREPSYTELYERNGSSRMHRDVTDESYSEESDLKRALGGGKVESAMEIVEIVNHDEPATIGNSLDDRAIEELAKINSVDKCTVWIEATQVHQKEQLPNIPEADHESRETGSS